MRKGSSCHPEQAFLAQRKPALGEVEGDLGEPRESSPERAQATEGRGWLASLLLVRRIQFLLIHFERQLAHRFRDFFVRRDILQIHRQQMFHQTES